MLDKPLECSEQQCFALSNDLNETDVHRWRMSEKPEEMSYLASVGKRAQAEVCIKNLSYEDRLLFVEKKPRG